MRVLLSALFISLLSIGLLAAPHIELSNELLDGDRLIPVIRINDRVVMRIQDKGADSMNYSSPFARAQNIYSLLNDLSQKGFDLSKIRVRKIKSSYVGEIKGLYVFTISSGDTKVAGLTAYQTAKQWTDAIAEAVSAPVPENAQQIPQADEDLYPFLYILNIFGGRHVILIVLQFIFVLLSQALITLLVVRHVKSKRVLNHKSAYQHITDLKEAQMKHRINIRQLQERITELEKELERGAPPTT